MLVVIHLEAVPAGAETLFDDEVAAGIVLPSVEHECSIDPEPCAIVNPHSEAVDTLLEVELACPAYAEVVHGDTRGWAAVPPVEGNLDVIAHESRLSEQIGVAEVLAAPLRKNDRPFPEEVDRGIPGALEVLHAEIVPACVQISLRTDGAQTAVLPIVDNQRSIYPNAHAIVHPDNEAHLAGVKPLAAGPAYAEEVWGNDPWRRAARTPVEANGGVDTHYQWRAQQVAVAEVLAQVAIDHDRCRRWRRHGRWRWPGSCCRSGPHGPCWDRRGGRWQHPSGYHCRNRGRNDDGRQ